MKKLTVLLFFVLMFLFVGQHQGFAQTRKVTIYYSNWAETVAMVAVTKVALEEVGISVNTVMAPPDECYAALASGKGDIMLETWLPQTHGSYWKQYGAKLDKLGTSFDEASTGLVVPAYVEANSIDELNQYKEKFKGRIVGIGSSAGVYKDTERAISEYGLDLVQEANSGPLMQQKLKEAIRNKEWVVVTGWKPHHKWIQYDLKYLDDPKSIYPSEKAYVLSSKGYTDEYPGMDTFLNNFHFDDIMLYELMLEFALSNDNPESIARAWYQDRRTVIREWMPDSWIE